MTEVSIALAQTNAVLGNVEANLERHLHWISRAMDANAQLIVFPELSLTGYYLRDLAHEIAIPTAGIAQRLSKLYRASRDLDIVCSFVERDDRGRFYVCAAYVSRGSLRHIHRKLYLPTYGLFEEGRYYSAGESLRAFDTRFGRVGMLICEDFWHVSPPYLLWLDGADVLLLMSASPARGLGKSEDLASVEWVERINQAYASMFTMFVAHTNRVGFEDGLHMAGQATVFDPEGQLVACGPPNEEALTLATIDLDQLRRTRAQLPLLRDERSGLVQRELARLLGQSRDPGRPLGGANDN